MRPMKVYDALQRLLVVERSCYGWAAIGWAHALERVWFDVFDPSLTVRPGRLLDACWRFFTIGQWLESRMMLPRPNAAMLYTQGKKEHPRRGNSSQHKAITRHASGKFGRAIH